MNKSFDVPLQDLRRALAQVIPFAHADGYLPSIHTVQWSTDGTALILTATDRYTVGRAKVRVSKDTEMDSFEPFSMKIPDAKRVLAIFKTQRGIPNQSVTVVPGSDGWEVRDNSVTLRGDTEKGRFVPCAEIFRGALANARRVEATTAVPQGWNPALIARFSIPNVPAVFWPAPPNKPTLITVGDWFTGLIMPVRVPNLDGQLDLLDAEFAEPAPLEEKPQAKPARKSRAKKVA